MVSLVALSNVTLESSLFVKNTANPVLYVQGSTPNTPSQDVIIDEVSLIGKEDNFAAEIVDSRVLITGTSSPCVRVPPVPLFVGLTCVNIYESMFSHAAQAPHLSHR